MADRVAALALGHQAWNAFRALFNPASAAIAAVPELAPVLQGFKSVADAAIAALPVIDAAIKDAGGLIPTTVTAEGHALAKELSDQVSALIQAFEAKSGFKVVALEVERSGTQVSVGHVSFVE